MVLNVKRIQQEKYPIFRGIFGNYKLILCSLLDFEIIEIGELGTSFLSKTIVFLFGLIIIISDGASGSRFTFTIEFVGIDDFKVVTSVILRTKSAKKGADGLGGSTTATNDATDIFWVDRK